MFRTVVFFRLHDTREPGQLIKTSGATHRMVQRDLVRNTDLRSQFLVGAKDNIGRDKKVARRAGPCCPMWNAATARRLQTKSVW